MLSPKGQFLEAKQPDGKREAHFFDDDPDALLILLNIAHLNFSQIPPRISWRTLLNIAVLCDKYDIVKLIRPWIGNWTEAFKHFADNAGSNG